jgi:hypothetical protein
MSAWTCQTANGKAALKIVPPHLRIPGLRADSEEKREPASDIETAEVDSLKALDPEWPIREVGHLQRSEFANSGHCHFQLPGERLAMMLTTLNVITTSPA